MRSVPTPHQLISVRYALEASTEVCVCVCVCGEVPCELTMRFFFFYTSVNAREQHCVCVWESVSTLFGRGNSFKSPVSLKKRHNLNLSGLFIKTGKVQMSLKRLCEVA